MGPSLTSALGRPNSKLPLSLGHPAGSLALPFLFGLANPKLVPPPQQYSTLDGTVQGLIDGGNRVFTLGVIVSRASIWKNGRLMTLNFDCTFNSRTLVFFPASTPQPGDVITVIA